MTECHIRRRQNSGPEYGVGENPDVGKTMMLASMTREDCRMSEVDAEIAKFREHIFGDTTDEHGNNRNRRHKIAQRAANKGILPTCRKTGLPSDTVIGYMVESRWESEPAGALGQRTNPYRRQLTETIAKIANFHARQGCAWSRPGTNGQYQCANKAGHWEPTCNQCAGAVTIGHAEDTIPHDWEDIVIRQRIADFEAAVAMYPDLVSKSCLWVRQMHGLDQMQLS